MIEATKPKTNGTTLIPGKPASTTERIVITLEGADTSPSTGEQVGRFREQLTKHPYFQSQLGPTNQVSLKSMSAPMPQPETGRMMVSFSLETRLPPKTR